MEKSQISRNKAGSSPLLLFLEISLFEELALKFITRFRPYRTDKDRDNDNERVSNIQYTLVALFSTSKKFPIWHLCTDHFFKVCFAHGRFSGEQK